MEKNVERVLALLPKPNAEHTLDCIQIDCNGEQGIVVLVTPETIEFRLPTIEWTKGAYEPVASSRFWKRIKANKITDIELETLIKEALKKRQCEFRYCRYCGELLSRVYAQQENLSWILGKIFRNNSLFKKK